MTFLGIVGSNADYSTNRLLLQFMRQQFQKDAQIEICEIKDLPAFNEPADRTAPAAIQAVIDQIQAADGVVISTPEYDHSISAALKSLLEWLAYTSTVLYNKPVMIVGASRGTLGTARAQAHLRQILDAPEIGARVLPHAEFLLGHSVQAFDDQGTLTDSAKVAELTQDWQAFQGFVQSVNQADISGQPAQVWEENA